MLTKITAVLAAALALLAVPGWGSGPYADYGDAPDPSYPSNYASTGPYHLDVTREWLGRGSSSTTTREWDSNQINNDFDDGTGYFFRTRNERSYFLTHVSYDPTVSSASDIRYLNVVTDLNGSGVWDGGNEWAVKNYAFSFANLPQGVTTLGLILRTPDFMPAEMLGYSTRVTLADTAVDNGSGEWGGFNRGETEDWIASLVDDNDPDFYPYVGKPDGDPPLPLIPKVKQVVREKVVKATRVTGPVTCACGATCALGVLCPNHVTTYKYDVTKPFGCNLLQLDYVKVAGCCGRNICDHSLVQQVGNPANNIVVVGGFATVYDTDAPGVDWFGPGNNVLNLETLNGLEYGEHHAGHRLICRGTFDPDGEYYEIFDYDEGMDYLPVPEPSSLLALAGGLGVLGGLIRRRKR